MYPLRRRVSSGFTLIEILVVVLIIGLAVGALSVAITPSTTLSLRAAARDFANQLAIVSAEAALGNQPWGIQFYRASGSEKSESVVAWRWLNYRPLSAADAKHPPGWQVEAPRDLAPDGHFASEVEAILAIEGVEVPIESLQASERRKRLSAQRDDASKHAKDTTQPDIWIAPGGEMTPFVLELRIAGELEGPRIRGDALGRIVLETDDETP
jgi:type II secretion system protein H